jgi:hypothetical protein
MNLQKIAQAILMAALGVASAGSFRAAESGSAFELAVSLAAGYDSNPLRLAGRESGAAFSELRGAASGQLELGAGTTAFATGSVSARIHERSARAADASYWDLRSGMRWSRRGEGARRVDLTVGGRMTGSRATFTDRLSGEVYSFGGAAVGDRFDANTTGGFAAARWVPQRRLRLQLGAEYERRNYVDDYAAVGGLDPIDSSAWLATPRVRFLVSDTVALEAGADWSSRSYEALPSVDATGTPIAGSARRDRGTAWRLSVDARPSARWDLSAGVVAAGRRDLGAGYYESDGKSAFVLAGLKAGKLNRIQLHLSEQKLDYAHATVANDPNGAVLGSDALRALARFERTLRSGMAFTVEAGVQRTNNVDPLYAYDRDWIQTAFRYKR